MQGRDDAQALRMHNPDALPVENPLDQQARWILSRHEILPSTAAGRIFHYGYMTLGGRGGELVFEPRTKLMMLCEIHSEAALRKAVAVLAKAGLVERGDHPRRGQACALVLRFLMAFVPPAQQVFPEMDYESPTVTVVGDRESEGPEESPERTASAHPECALEVRTGSAHSKCALTQSETGCLNEAHASNLKQPEHPARETLSFDQQSGQAGGGGIEGEDVESEVEDETEPSSAADPAAVGLRFLTLVRRIEQKLDFARKVPTAWRWLAPAWSYAFCCGLLSEHDVEDSLMYAVEIPREKLITGDRVKACRGKLENILRAKARESVAFRERLARHKMLDAKGWVRWPRFPTLKQAVKQWGLEWDERWDQQPAPARGRT